MIKIEDKSKCSGCYSCVNICPKKCIEMKTDSEGFWYPKVNTEKCIECGLCEKHCPILKDMNNKNVAQAFACYNKDVEIRKKSSSGGVFTLLASYIIDNGGIVYGASFNQNFEVEHIEITQKEDLSKVRGSKYVQSKLGDTYLKIRHNLENNKLVYFSGTPCQVDGLLCFLNKKYNNLICQDLICHGVPSPKIWRKYLNEQKDRIGGKIKSINFRNKKYSWESYDMCIEYENHSYNQIHNKNIFMQVFLKDLCLRPSCYSCQSKSLHRNSDITLADFWGVKEVCPEIYDNMGVSLVFINSDCGKKIFNNIKNNMEYHEVDIKEATKFNRSAFKSVYKPENRDEFMRNVFNKNFEKYSKKYIKTPFVLRVKIVISKLLFKLGLIKKSS